MKTMIGNRNNILWIDCLGGLFVGVTVLIFYPRICGWDGLPGSVVIAMGMANLAYGLYSLFVTTRNSRSLMLVKVLASANMTWLVVCVVLVFLYWNQISAFGILHFVGEGIYVACLGVFEWIWRRDLSEKA